MVFSSIEFLFYFLPIVIAIYFAVFFLTKSKYTPINLVLLLSSLIFYIKGEKGLVVVMLFSGTVDYFIGWYISQVYERKPNLDKPIFSQKLALIGSIFVNLFVLFYFKYSNFFIEQINSLTSSEFSYLNVTLPLGISFYTFQSMSYTLDIYFRNIKANKNYIDYTSYITMFPQLVAGPIVRYKDIQYQLRNRSHSVKNISTGFKRFTFGLSKKVIVANSIAFYADEIFALNEVYLNTPLAWLGAFCYALQIYFDFSGYSDMAIGLGEIFGFHFPENFNYPYMAKSIQDFWRRWHISLSSWFRDYLYIPLGGSRFGPAKTYRNLFIVFVLCGFWHGASWTFIIWGLYHGFFLVVERALKGSRIKTLPSFMKHTYTVFVFIVGWVIFRAETLEKLKLFLVKMFIPYWENMDLLNRVLSQPKFIFAAIAGVIFSVPTMPMMRKVIAKYVSKHELDWRITLVGKITIYGFFFIICCISLIGDDYNPFIYFRF